MTTVVVNRPSPVTVVNRARTTDIALTPRQVSRIEALRGVNVTARPAPVSAVSSPRPVDVGGTGRRGPKGADGAGAVPAISFAFGDAPRTVWTAEVNGILSGARLSIEHAFDGDGAAIMVGVQSNPSAVMQAGQSDPKTAGDYEVTPDIVMMAGQTVTITITPGAGASAGDGFLLLTFIPD